jgi:YHS domain-containing protein
MLKVLGTLIEWLIMFLIARSVISSVVRFFRNTSEAPGAPPVQRPPGELPSAGELRKDPVCETYISVPSPWAKLVKGETIYFCSKECRDRFRG